MQQQQQQAQQPDSFKEGMKLAHKLAALGTALLIPLIHLGQGLNALKPSVIAFLFFALCLFKALPGGSDIGTAFFAWVWLALAILRYREANGAFKNGVRRHSEYWGHSYLFPLVSPLMADMPFLPESWRTLSELKFQCRVEPIVIFAAGAMIGVLSQGIGFILMACAIAYFCHGYRSEAEFRDRLIRMDDKALEAEHLQNIVSGKPSTPSEGFAVQGLDSVPEERRSRFADALRQSNPDLAALMDEPPPTGHKQTGSAPDPRDRSHSAD